MSALAAAWAEALLALTWQGMLIGGVVAVLRAGAPSPAVRYGVTALGLLAIPGLAVCTTLRHLHAPAAAAAGEATLSAWIVPVWLVGASLLSIRFALGWWRLSRLRHDVLPLAAAGQARVRALAARMGLRRAPRLVEAAWAQGPLTLGWWRPLVVVPLGFLTAWPPACVDALLMHELAHVARRDYLHGLVQRVVEAIFFFHPVVWWLSRRLTVDREECCDDRVVARLTDRRPYIAGLARLAALRAEPMAPPAAHGGALVHRIRRLVHPPRRSGAPRSLLAMLLLVGLTLPALADSPAPTGVQWLPPAVQAHAALFEAAGEAHQIDPRLLAIMAWVESRGNLKAVSSAGSRGLMQVMPATGRKIAKARGLRWRPGQLDNPRVNVDYGAWYLKRQLDRFGSVELAVAAYNAGPGHVRAWLKGKTPLRAETRRYMNYVNALWSERDAATSKTLARRRAGR